MNISSKPLPLLYLVTPNPDTENEPSRLIDQLEKSLTNGIRLVQFRAKTLSPEKYKAFAIRVMACCEKYNATLMLNADPGLLNEVGAHGLHLDGTRLAACRHRPISTDKLLSAACHSLEQIKKVEEIGVNMVTLSPVLATATQTI